MSDRPLTIARNLRHRSTDAERKFWRYLRAGQLGHKIRRQQPLGPYVVDFVCFEARLVIELDGGQHAAQTEQDAKRDSWLRSQGFRVLRFWNNEVMNEFEGVMEKIFQELNAPLPQPLPREGGGENSAPSDSLHQTTKQTNQGDRR